MTIENQNFIYGYIKGRQFSQNGITYGVYQVYGADGAVPYDGTIRTVHTTYAAALKTTTLPKTRCRKPYAATQYLMLLMIGVCTRYMSS